LTPLTRALNRNPVSDDFKPSYDDLVPPEKWESQVPEWVLGKIKCEADAWSVKQADIHRQQTEWLIRAAITNRHYLQKIEKKESENASRLKHLEEWHQRFTGRWGFAAASMIILFSAICGAIAESVVRGFSTIFHR
jgi:hypothetical protein